jgi:hypothetical protein
MYVFKLLSVHSGVLLKKKTINQLTPQFQQDGSLSKQNSPHATSVIFKRYIPMKHTDFYILMKHRDVTTKFYKLCDRTGQLMTQEYSLTVLKNYIILQLHGEKNKPVKNLPEFHSELLEISPEIGTSSINLAQLSKLFLKAETECSL